MSEKRAIGRPSKYNANMQKLAEAYLLNHKELQGDLVPLCVKHHKEIEMMFVDTERFGVTPETEMVWRNMIRSMQATTAYRIKEALNATA